MQGAPNRVHCESWFRVWFLQDTGETKTTSGYQRTKWLPCRKVTIIYQFTGFCVILAANEISHCMQMVKRYRDPLPAHKKQDLKKKFKTKIRKPKTWITRLCSLTCLEVISLTAPATPQTPGRWPLWPASVARYDPFIPSPGPPWISMAFSSFIGEYNHIHLRSNIVHIYIHIYTSYIYICMYIYMCMSP